MVSRFMPASMTAASVVNSVRNAGPKATREKPIMAPTPKEYPRQIR